MKNIILSIVLAVAVCGCASTPKLNQNGEPPPGYKVVPVVPPAF